MKRIFKYELKVTDEQKIQTFRGFKPLSVQFQRGVLCLWMLVDDSETPYFAEVAIFGTGHPCECNETSYVGTVMTENEYLVWHVFVYQCNW